MADSTKTMPTVSSTESVSTASTSANGTGDVVTIRCEDSPARTVPVSTLTQLEWFRKALRHYQEPGEIVIEYGLTDTGLSHVIDWLNNGHAFVTPVFLDRNSQFEAYVHVSKAMEFFQSGWRDDGRLSNAVMGGFMYALDSLVRDAGARFGPGQPEERNEAAVRQAYDGFFRGVELAYDWDDGFCQDLFMDSVTRYGWMPFRNVHFVAMAQQRVPEYLDDLVEKLSLDDLVKEKWPLDWAFFLR